VEVIVSQIGSIDKKRFFPGNFVTIRGRVIRLYFDIFRRDAYLTVEDGTGGILVRVKEAPSQTVMVGTVVNVRGALKIYENSFL